MTSLAFAAPCLPGGADLLRHLAQEVRGVRRAEYEDFHRRVSLIDESWYIQQTPQGEMCIVYLRGEDPAQSIATLASSNYPFDVWFKQEIKRVHGIDFNQPPAGPLPEVVNEPVAAPARTIGVGAI